MSHAPGAESPLSLAPDADPYPLYARLLAGPPVHLADGVHWLSRYPHVLRGLADYEAFSSARGVSLEGSGDIASILELDPPRHGRVRAVIAPGLRKRAVRGLAPSVRAIALECVRQAGATPFDVAPLAGRVVRAVVATLLGVPDHARERVAALVDGALSGRIADRAEFAELRRLVTTLDLNSAAVTNAAERRAGRAPGLTAAERRELCLSLLLGGQEPLSTGICAAAHWAYSGGLTTGDGLAGPDPDLVLGEVLRLAAPTQYMLRTATTEVSVDGCRVPPGATVGLLLAAANRDPAVFPDPEVLRTDRTVRPLTFGHGAHTCVARWLAHLVLRETVAALIAVHPPSGLQAGRPVWRWSGNARVIRTMLIGDPETRAGGT